MVILEYSGGWVLYRIVVISKCSYSFLMCNRYLLLPELTLFTRYVQ